MSLNRPTAEMKAEILKSAVIFTEDQVKDAWSKSEFSHLQLISTNKKYRGLPRDEWDAILATQFTVANRYEPDLFDCDGFSCAFMGLIAWDFDVNGVVRILDSSAGHSYNAVLVASDDGKSCSFIGIEPQTDTVIGNPPKNITVTAPAGAYKAERGFAITV